MFPQGFYLLTPIIDEEQTILEKTEAALGAGRPLIGGDQYRAVTAELRTVATDMNRACLLATAWQGLAGIAFAAEIQVYTNVVNQMALLHSAAAQCVDAQAVAVLQARKGLEHLAFRLVVCQIEARNAALAGNMAAVLEI